MTNHDELRGELAALFRSPPGAGRLGDEPPGVIADAVIEALPRYVARLLDANERLRQDLETLRWLHAEAVWQRDQSVMEAANEAAKFRALQEQVADLVEMVKVCTGHPDTGLPAHFDLIQRERLSRQAWAEEAMRLHEVLLHLSTELGEAGMDHLAAAAQLSDPRWAVHPDGQSLNG